MRGTKRGTVRAIFLAAALMTAMAARPQMVDPTTGIMVDPATDPMDFSAVLSGQAGNAAMEAAVQNLQQTQAQMAANDAGNGTLFPASSDDASTAVAAPVEPVTPKPAMSPNGGKVAAGATVTITDQDPGAIIFFTTDGTKPTPSSARYAAPIALTARTKVSAMALDVTERPSGVVSKTFKIKS